MNFTKVTPLSGAVFATVFASSIAFADKNVIDSCIAKVEKKSDGTLCEVYINGFVEGALVTDATIIDNFTDKESGFFQRAYQTRTMRDEPELPATYLAKFCLPEPIAMPNVVETIVNNIDRKALKNQPLKGVIYESLKRSYPCES